MCNRFFFFGRYHTEAPILSLPVTFFIQILSATKCCHRRHFVVGVVSSSSNSPRKRKNKEKWATTRANFPTGSTLVPTLPRKNRPLFDPLFCPLFCPLFDPLFDPLSCRLWRVFSPLSYPLFCLVFCPVFYPLFWPLFRPLLILRVKKY